MSAAIKRTVYHVGDLVKIVKPEIFIRVGYPLTKTDALAAAEKQYSEKIYDFMANILEPPAEFVITEADPRLYGDLVDALASYWIRSKGYGGKERKIYTETHESLRNTSGWRVVSKRMVKTGTYCRGGYSSGWDGEPDYDPPYLSNEETHPLLTVESNPKLELWRKEIQLMGQVEIEAANVELEHVNAAT